MRQGNTWHRLDFNYFQNTKIRLPLMKPIERIMIRTEILRKGGYTSNRLLEHPTKRRTIDHSPMNAKADDAACELVHDNEYPIGSQS